MRCFVPDQLHEPFRRFAFDLEHHLSLQLAQPFLREKEGNEDRRNADGHEPFVADVAGWMEEQSLLRKFVMKTLDERLQFRALQLQTELRNSSLEQLLVAQIGPVDGVHAAHRSSR